MDLPLANGRLCWRQLVMLMINALMMITSNTTGATSTPCHISSGLSHPDCLIWIVSSGLWTCRGANQCCGLAEEQINGLQKAVQARLRKAMAWMGADNCLRQLLW
jgi:hypothetical protein